MKILAKNYTNENYWAEYALITIDDDAKKEILEAKELHQMVTSKNKSLHALEFWDGRAEYFAADEEAFTEEQLEELEEHNFMIVPHETTLESFEGAEESRTELDCLVVQDNGFYWTAVGKHTDDSVETPHLKFDLLL